ncbi:hypothetical protein Droror1_Dr00002232 [Drosera rotundifolia]
MELSKLAKSAFESLGKESILASLAGKIVVVATLTSSGKSLCYNIPVLEVLSQNMLACAMYFFPTKALAQDQLRVFLTMVKGLDVNFNVGIYDGDTSEADRTWSRDNARVVVESGTGDKPSTKRKIVMRRSSPIMELSNLLAEMVQHGLRCMAFCKTRKLCELVLSYTREILQDIGPELMDSVCADRGGYMAEVWRRIEGECFCGKLRGIAATNALELGIDVRHIDVTLHLGFPGTVASLWQQAGRLGRRGKPSLAEYVAFEGPLDQYFMRFPQKLFRSRIEHCLIDAQNKQVLEQNLICAALEHPLSLIYDEKFFGSCLNSAIKALESRGYLSCDSSHGSTRTWSYIGQEIGTYIEYFKCSWLVVKALEISDGEQ